MYSCHASRISEILSIFSRYKCITWFGCAGNSAVHAVAERATNNSKESCVDRNPATECDKAERASANLIQRPTMLSTLFRWNGKEETEKQIRKRGRIKERKKTRPVLNLITGIAAKVADKPARSLQLDSGTQRRASKETYLR